MTEYRKIAIFAGILFITATVSSVASFMGIMEPIFSQPDYLSQLAAQRGLVATGISLELVNNTAVIALGLVLYPVLRAYSVVLALGYLALRVGEAIFITIGDLSILTLTSLAEAFVAGGMQYTETYQISADILKSVVDWSLIIGPGLYLAANALILNYVLWRAKLVPVFLSLWGLIGAILLLIGDILAMYGIGEVLMFAAPFALQEMVLAVWLIARGFSAQAIQATSSA